MRRKRTMAVVLAAVIASGTTFIAGQVPAGAAVADPSWNGTWGAAMQRGDATFRDQTLRQIVHTSIAGDSVRLRFSNVYGTGALTIGRAHVAGSAGGSSITAGTDHAVTFGGSASVTIPAGSSVASDPVDFAVEAESNLAVSLYLPQQTGPSTFHQEAKQTNFAVTGDQTAAPSLTSTQNFFSYFFLTGLDVQNDTAAGTLVTLGASITDGYGSSHEANRRWPNLLANRLNASNRTVGVVNAGISGNGLIFDGGGESALKRFDRDVLDQPGVRWVIFSDDAINDLGNSNPPSDQQLRDALSQLITRAHARGIQFFCSTLTPYEGASYWTQRGEAGREAVNAFVRSQDSGCDAVIDQDGATHDPARPTWYLPAYDSGDHLHPNDAGMQAIADAVDPGLFGAANGPVPVNLALDRPITSSSDEPGTGNDAADAVDGDLATRWASGGHAPQWLRVDLGEQHPVGRVVIDWEYAYASGYQIQTSDDDRNWTSVYTTATGDGAKDTLEVKGAGRYVRLLVSQEGTAYGPSLWEFAVFES